jgi:hypothetical protein
VIVPWFLIASTPRLLRIATPLAEPSISPPTRFRKMLSPPEPEGAKLTATPLPLPPVMVPKFRRVFPVPAAVPSSTPIPSGPSVETVPKVLTSFSSPNRIPIPEAPLTSMVWKL